MEDDRVILLESSYGSPRDEEEDLELENIIRGNINNKSVPNGSQTSSIDEPAPIVYVAAGVAAVGGLLFGYDMGIISGAKSTMQKELLLSCAEIERIVAFLPVGALFASFVGGFLVDRFGRKWTIILNAFLFTFGAGIMSFTSNYLALLFGRFVLGFSVCLSAIAECIYISEISTPEKRGMLISLNELGITVGILLAFLVNYCFTATPGGWRIMFGLSAVVAIAQGIAMLFLPQTPQFLMIKKQEAKAEQVLRKLKITTNIRQTLTNIRLSLTEDDSRSCMSFLTNKSDRMQFRLFIGFGLVFFQQFTGQPNIIYYAADVFKQVGFCDELSSTLASVGLGLMKVLATVISLVLIDRLGRRFALLSGITMMMLSVLTLSVFAFYEEQVGGTMNHETCTEPSINGTTAHPKIIDFFAPSDNKSTNASEEYQFEVDFSCPDYHTSLAMRYIGFIALVCFVCSFSFSFGPVTWILLTEIFPPASKGRAMSLATSLNWLGNVVVSATFLQATATFTLGGVFLFYGLMCIAAILFTFLFIPETKNRSLEEISKELKNKKARSMIREHIPCLKQRSSPRHNVDIDSYLRVSVTDHPVI